MAYDTILYEVRERICTITLNRPEHMNSYNSQMCQEINLALDAADSDDDVRVVIFTGAEGGKRPVLISPLTGPSIFRKQVSTTPGTPAAPTPCAFTPCANPSLPP